MPGALFGLIEPNSASRTNKKNSQIVSYSSIAVTQTANRQLPTANCHCRRMCTIRCAVFVHAPQEHQMGHLFKVHGFGVPSVGGRAGVSTAPRWLHTILAVQRDCEHETISPSPTNEGSAWPRPKPQRALTASPARAKEQAVPQPMSPLMVGGRAATLNSPHTMRHGVPGGGVTKREHPLWGRGTTVGAYC